MTCDQDGKCHCGCDIRGDKCNECEFGHHGFPNCTGKLTQTFDQIAISNCLSNTEKSSFRLAGCQCSRIGTAKCDVFGRCLCHTGYNGTMCDQCQNGYSKNDSGSCKGTLLFFLEFYVLSEQG